MIFVVDKNINSYRRLNNAKYKILIVEDNPIIALDIRNIIQKLNYIVTDIVSNEVSTLTSIEENEPNIILMDINLNHNQNGIKITKEIHKTKQIPIIYLSGVTDENIIANALETNPAYYLTKPFNRIQLKSAIKVVINQHYQNKQNYIHLGCDYFFDIKLKKLYHKNQIQKLGNKEIKFIDLLIEANGRVVLYETIENVIWENEPITNDAIRLLVSRLRKKINCKIIETIYSHGFKINKNL